MMHHAYFISLFSQFQCPIDDANITRLNNELFKIFTSQEMALQLYFRSTRDADIFQRSLGRLQFRDESM